MKSNSRRGIRALARPLKTACSVALLLGATHHLAAQDTFEERAQRILDSLTSVEVSSPGGSGKLPYGRANAHLAATGGTSSAAQTYLIESGYGGGDFMFNALQKARGLYLAKDQLSQAQLDAFQEQAESVDFDWNNSGTENHRKMTWSSGYLYAQAFPDGEWIFDGETVDSATLMARMKERLSEVGQNEFLGGYSEFLSPNYEIFHVAPMINLYDYAEDSEVRAIAEASLVHHFTLMALASYEEVVLPPWSRYAGVQTSDATGAPIQLLPWLFWGHGNLPSNYAVNPVDPHYFFALSDWRPPEILERISQREVDFPYTALMQQTHWQWNTLRYVMRTTYQEQLFNLSSGVVRYLPGAFQLDDSQFAIAWEGGASIRQIQAFHPYWRNEQNLAQNDWRAPTSPFMQTAQHGDTAIQLYDIPAEDPWSGIGQWAGERADTQIPLAQFRFPSHMDFTSTDDNWIFLADGPVYIAVKVLKPDWDRQRRAIPGWNIIQSWGTEGERWQTGFIYELGTEEEFGSLDAFIADVEDNPLTVDWETMSVSYTTTAGDVFDYQHNPLEADENRVWPAIPDFAVNGQPVAYDESWPVMDSPWTSLRDRVMILQLNDSEYWVADYNQSVPSITVTDEIGTAPEVTGNPADLTVDAGGSATFSVSTTGTEPLTYQWFKDGTALDGATGAELVLNGVTADDAGAYSVEVSNIAGSATSTAATLTVVTAEPPSITQAPVSAEVDAEGNVTFSVEATGTEPLAYQWLKDGTAIDGATGSELTITGVLVDDAGSYTVEVSNSAGTVTSDPATLTVNDPGPETWAGFVVEPNGWVNTGDFLGWVYPDGDFVLVFAMGRYIYLPESFFDGNGSWAFVGR